MLKFSDTRVSFQLALPLHVERETTVKTKEKREVFLFREGSNDLVRFLLCYFHHEVFFV